MGGDKQEIERIRKVYGKRDIACGGRYAWYKPDVQLSKYARFRWVSSVMFRHFGEDISNLSVLDVGCGTGVFLRELVEAGADPNKLTGTELLEDRLTVARRSTAPGVSWVLGDLDALPSDEMFHIVSAFTVFSSILNDEFRKRLADKMWQRLLPGGVLMVFDFRFDNPANLDVRRVTKKELCTWWPSGNSSFNTLLLAPPLLRRIAPHSSTICQAFEALCPFLRSHFIFSVKKG